MRITRYCDIDKDLRLLKRFPAPLLSLEAWERLFCLKGLKETPGIEKIPGFGALKIHKARVVPLRENVGKSKGYRLIFQIFNNGDCKILVFSRHGVYKTEQGLIQLVKMRLQN